MNADHDVIVVVGSSPGASTQVPSVRAEPPQGRCPSTSPPEGHRPPSKAKAWKPSTQVSGPLLVARQSLPLIPNGPLPFAGGHRDDGPLQPGTQTYLALPRSEPPG
jgi:hypothetical protein